MQALNKTCHHKNTIAPVILLILSACSGATTPSNLPCVIRCSRCVWCVAVDVLRCGRKKRFRNSLVLEPQRSFPLCVFKPPR
ncbi:hypothetical protein PF005_g291 [Phytophthora fragariae]|uniref:Secreted protein n=1 Tax=Phytophthora fragariae TaxID=53985 RepID=A0A6A3TQB2_9STRA|nr:hypothetical protein PF003_g26380 [Phytophthora fragariae]KAE8950270.1 hypothetical protein PF009_g239 [Phytophthora fragariae]KAE9026671.1 hypothetical protein PF011_g2433 [Phytophthora fragariae]KAE9136700.1 hypothetical protein PF010_g1582 [Phytophthora fragariae]KAE9141423.1 hypothetical protein PF007_g240 [Phytophthora fragariae]